MYVPWCGEEELEMVWMGGQKWNDSRLAMT